MWNAIAGRTTLASAMLFLGFVGGFALRSYAATPRPSQVERQTNRLSRLTSPFLECVGEKTGSLGIVRVRADAVRLIRRARGSDSTLRVSVYARDLNNGPWIGIDESVAQFTPASMWKVPLMAYILAMAEDDPAVLDRPLTFPGPDMMRYQDSMVGASAERQLETGHSYTYRELLFRMIAYSDNYAEELLMTGLTKRHIDQLLAAINAEDTYVAGQPLVSPRTYSALLRVLYNSTLFSRTRSEYGLSLLAQSDFRHGLRRHLPPEVMVASKFGLRKSENEVQFHECGIIYHPTKPYTLCVMTRSRQATPERLAEIVADISRTVWEGAHSGEFLTSSIVAARTE